MKSYFPRLCLDLDLEIKLHISFLGNNWVILKSKIVDTITGV